MRTPSRRMPPLPGATSTSLGCQVAAAFAFGGFLAVVATDLRLLVVVSLLACSIVVVSAYQAIRDRRRMARLADGREGESICTFARSFDRRGLDTWVVRAVHEELQPYCRFGSRTLPLRATDRLAEDLLIDDEELEDIVVDVADRVGRSLEGYEANPRYGRFATVADLVAFLMHQPTTSRT